MNKIGYLVAFFAGVIFAVGLVVGGMTQPLKVVSFLDFFGQWDPSLAFVMGGAVLVNTVAYRLVFRRERPMCDERFHTPTSTEITSPLVVGSAIFGVGWGMAGFCPGPALTSLPVASSEVLVFAAAMAGGVAVHTVVDRTLLADGGDAEAGERVEVGTAE